MSDKKIVNLPNDQKKLSTGRVIKLRDMSIDDMDFCNDITTIHQNDAGATHFSGLAKSRTAWLRRGIAGGDFNNFKLDAKGQVDDSTLKQLSETEKNELISIIQGYQVVGEENPST